MELCKNKHTQKIVTVPWDLPDLPSQEMQSKSNEGDVGYMGGEGVCHLIKM